MLRFVAVWKEQNMNLIALTEDLQAGKKTCSSLSFSKEFFNFEAKLEHCIS